MNWLARSEDDGLTWRLLPAYDTRRRPIVGPGSGPRTGLSEIGFEPIGAGRLVGIARVDGIRSRMIHLEGRELGGLWTRAPDLPLPVGGGYVSPDVVTLPRRATGSARDVLLAFVMVRASRGAGLGSLEMLCAAFPFAGSAPVWHRLGPVETDLTLAWRSGYSTALVGDDTIVIALHDEVSTSDADAHALRVSVRDLTGRSGWKGCADGR